LIVDSCFLVSVVLRTSCLVSWLRRKDRIWRMPRITWLWAMPRWSRSWKRSKIRFSYDWVRPKEVRLTTSTSFRR